MEKIRFEKFTLLIDGIHKSISKMKLDAAPYMGVKGVHVFWIYEISKHDGGLTSAELAAVSRVDRSLVSREIAALMKGGYISSLGRGGAKRYNDRFVLTERGRELAEWIKERVLGVQNAVSAGIDEEELAVFYSVLERLSANFEQLAEDMKASMSSEDKIREDNKFQGEIL